jgi:hypothetical protein
MVKRIFIMTVTSLVVMALLNASFFLPSTAWASGDGRIRGIGEYAAPGQCVDPEGAGSDYAISMVGDLRGCLYAFIATSFCSPNGAYRETGSEVFVSHNEQQGTFQTTYIFVARYADCENFVGEIMGHCYHPLVAGSGTDDFEGVTGVIRFWDDVVVGNFPYHGKISYP